MPSLVFVSVETLDDSDRVFGLKVEDARFSGAEADFCRKAKSCYLHPLDRHGVALARELCDRQSAIIIEITFRPGTAQAAYIAHAFIGFALLFSRVCVSVFHQACEPLHGFDVVVAWGRGVRLRERVPILVQEAQCALAREVVHAEQILDFCGSRGPVLWR
jgi:hypothetical protein